MGARERVAEWNGTQSSTEVRGFRGRRDSVGAADAWAGACAADLCCFKQPARKERLPLYLRGRVVQTVRFVYPTRGFGAVLHLATTANSRLI